MLVVDAGAAIAAFGIGGRRKVLGLVEEGILKQPIATWACQGKVDQ